MFILLELLIEFPQQGSVGRIPKRRVELLLGVRVKAFLTIAEEVVLFCGLHQEAFSKNWGEFSLEFLNALLVLIVKVGSNFRTKVI